MRGKLHVPFDLTDVLHNAWIRHDVAGRLVIEEIPCGGDAVICLQEDGTFMYLGYGAILVVFGALDWAVALELHLAEERPVLGLVVDGVSCAIPVDAKKLSGTVPADV